MRDLNDMLSVGAADVGRTVRIAPPSAVRARADKRRTTTAALSVVAMGTLVAVGAGAVVSGGGLSMSPGTGPPGDSFPAGFTMPHQGDRGWQLDRSRNAPAAFPGCGGSDATLPGRTDARTIIGPSGAEFVGDAPNRLVNQVLLYKDEAAASTAFDGLADAIYACDWRLEEAEYESGSQSLTGNHPKIRRPDFSGLWEYVEARRIGRAVLINYGGRSANRWAGTTVYFDDMGRMGAETCGMMRLCPPGTPPPGEPRPTGGASRSPGTGPPHKEIPEQLTMPHESEPGWQRDDSRDHPGAFPGCGGSDPTRPGRIDARTLTRLKDNRGGQPPDLNVAQVLLYESNKAAASAVAGLGAAARACGWNVYEHENMDPPLYGWKYVSEHPDFEGGWVHARQTGAVVVLFYEWIRGDGAALGTNELIRITEELCYGMRLCLAGTPPPR